MTLCLSSSSSLDRITLVLLRKRSLHGGLSIEGRNVKRFLSIAKVHFWNVVSFRRQMELRAELKLNFSAKERVYILSSARKLSYVNRTSLYWYLT